MNRAAITILFASTAWAGALPTSQPAGQVSSPPLDLRGAAKRLFAEKNLVAWCIVPFDARRRGPEERAEMLRRLGFTRFAYDWRSEHIPTFD